MKATAKNTEPESNDEQLRESTLHQFEEREHGPIDKEEAWRRRNAVIIADLHNESLRYFSRMSAIANTSDGFQILYGNISELNVKGYELRSDYEREIVIDARNKVSIGPTFDSLANELILIGAKEGYIVSPKVRTKAFDSKDRHKRAHETGKLLCIAGGHELMQAAAYRVRLIGLNGGLLDWCWHGIGEWRA